VARGCKGGRALSGRVLDCETVCREPGLLPEERIVVRDWTPLEVLNPLERPGGFPDPSEVLTWGCLKLRWDPKETCVGWKPPGAHELGVELHSGCTPGAHRIQIWHELNNSHVIRTGCSTLLSRFSFRQKSQNKIGRYRHCPVPPDSFVRSGAGLPGHRQPGEAMEVAGMGRTLAASPWPGRRSSASPRRSRWEP